MKLPEYCLKRLFLANILLLCIVSMGCATMANLNGSPTTLMQMPGLEEPEYFGGLKRYSEGQFGLGAIGDGGLFVIADTPLTLVGDVLTLPLVHEKRRNWKPDQKLTGSPFEHHVATEMVDFARSSH